ncbi:MAG: serine/threonine-protein kinase, partial [Chloroflexota bacterium]|nr:serine/threonine-protein kinase [Chloroflexota bacterium]
MPDLTGKTLGRYTILERVGRGGMADVYRAHQPSLDRDVAIKVLNPFLLNDSANSDRFRREAQAVAALHHSNIVQVLDYDSEGETFYMVMAFIAGSTLKAVLDDHAAHGTRLSLGEIGTIMTAIGSALSYAHNRGMIHRDIKPQNIMFTSEGTPMLTDFGIARMVHGATASISGGLSGTPAYMSPEQGKGEPLDPRSDIYSLGVVLYEMLTSRVPFAADTPFAVVIKHMNDPLPPPRSVNPAIPEPLERVVLRALAKSPAERYQTVDELVQATQAAIAAAQAAGAATIPVIAPPGPAAAPVARVLVSPPAPAPAPAPVAPAVDRINCPKCGGSNPAGSRYCDQCSAPLDGTLPPRNRTVLPAAVVSTAPVWVAHPPAGGPPPPISPPAPALVTPPAVSVPVTAALGTPPPLMPPPAARPARSGGLSPVLLVGALLAIGVFLGAGLIALLTSSKTPVPVADAAAQATVSAISVQSTQLVVQQLVLQTTMTAAAGLSGAAQQTAVDAATAQAQAAAGTATALIQVAADSAATAQARATGTTLAAIADAAGQATAAANVTAIAAGTAQASATAQAQAQAAAQAQAGTATAQVGVAQTQVGMARFQAQATAAAIAQAQT